MKRRLLIAAALLLAAAALAMVWQGRETRSETGSIGLFTSLPILWAETADISDLLRSDAPQHWARATLEQRGTLVALDSLVRPDGQSALLGIKRLVMAQPRALSPAENVALDDWVRGGGHLLLLADPMLTEDSAFAIGDRRRPQDVVLLSPILTRWGLELIFDEYQEFIDDGPVGVDGMVLTLNMPGRFEPYGTDQPCRISSEGALADCRIGKGHALILADAAVLERDDPDGIRNAAFKALIERAFQ